MSASGSKAKSEETSVTLPTRVKVTCSFLQHNKLPKRGFYHVAPDDVKTINAVFASRPLVAST
jgi:hypothetical protein